MGLDIHLITDNSEEISRSQNANNHVDYFNQHSLSRTFCNLMSRRNVIGEEPELDQIGRLTDINISVLYDMEQIWSVEYIDYRLSIAETENEKQTVFEQIAASKEKLNGNINLILETIEGLIKKLSQFSNLGDKLNSYGEDTLGYDYYFTDFNLDKGEGYIGNNFGQDLRNFRKFLEYAKTNDARTVLFNYG